MKPIHAPFYDGYVALVKHLSLQKALELSLDEMKALFETIQEDRADYRYAENKWTIRQVLQHITDAERVFIYRALSISRKDPTPLPGFDENTWAGHTVLSNRPLSQLMKELELLRQSNIMFFEALSEDELLAEGTASEKRINVIALGYIIAGHQKHHCNILKERYLMN